MESGLQCAVMYEGCDGLSKNVSQVWRGVTGRLGAGEASKTAGLSGFREKNPENRVILGHPEAWGSGLGCS